MFQAISRFLDRVEDTAMIVLMSVATVITVTQVFFRYVLNNSIFWAEEVVLYGIICMSFVGASMGVRYGAHISMDLLKAVIRPSMLRWLQIVSALLGLLFAAALAYYGGKLFLITLSRGQMSPALRIPVAWVYLPMAVSGFVLIFRYASVIVRAWKGETVPGEGTESAVA